MRDQLPYIPWYINDALRSLEGFGPEIVLAAAFLIVIVSDIFSSRNSRLPFWLTLAGLLTGGFFTVQQLHTVPVPLFGGMLLLDHFAVLFKLIFLLAGFLFLIFLKGNRNFQTHSKGTGDAYSVFLAVMLGMNLMAMSSNLLMVYISIEMVSIGSYLLVGYISKDTRQAEAAVKYVIFGAVCSAIMLYGLSLLYGFSGTLDLNNAELIQGMSAVSPAVSAFVIVLVLTGIGFKLSAVPFHLWSPDVYEGAPTPVTAFLSTAPKAAGFAILIRFLAPLRSAGAEQLIFNFDAVLGIAAIAGMIVGNFGAIWQNNLKRMLAYSSIGHTGFLLMAVVAWSDAGAKALIFYLFVYVLMNMAAFILADKIEEATGSGEISAYSGLGKRLTVLMLCFVIVLVSLTGLPPTAGFTAKFLVFSAALNNYNAAGSPILLFVMITGALTTVVSLFYYFKVPLYAFLKEGNGNSAVFVTKSSSVIAVVLALSLIVLLIFPEIITFFL